MNKQAESNITLTNKELIKHCEFLIEDFCKNGFLSHHWTMRIPAEPNRDPDLVFAKLIHRFKAIIHDMEGQKHG